MDNFSDFKVWGFISVMAVLFGSLLVGNMLKKGIKPIQQSLIPTSVLGGGVLLQDRELLNRYAKKNK